ncbi:phytoene desaturase family protein [Corynebacterium camporealensis]|uniref:phytoene desaturase family protein n=1 Tax=Corynebacterium camporealensis TaxID=161896 RepID=UPI0034CFBB6B
MTLPGLAPKPPAEVDSALVIGAGVAGLATAGLLAEHGIKVTVIERGPRAGGRAGELEVDGFRFETGPSWYLMPEAFDRYFDLLGTSTAQELDLQLLDPGYRVFPEGKTPLDVPHGREAVAEFFESVEPGAGARLENYLDSAKKIYDTALQHLLYTNYTTPAPFLNREVLAQAGRFVRMLFQSLDSYVDSQFSDVRLQQILKYPAVFLSTQPATAPSLYHLMSHTDLELGVQYPQGGFTSLIDAMERLARERDVEFRYDTEAVEITTSDGRATGVRVRHEGQNETLTADIVVSCADLHHTENALLKPEERTFSERYFARRDPGLGTTLVLLGVEGNLPQLDHHNLFFSEKWEEDFEVVYGDDVQAHAQQSSRSIYVCKPSQTDDSVAPEGYENLFVLIPVPAAEVVGHGDAYGASESAAVKRAADAAIEQIAQWAEIPDLAERIVVRRTIGPADFADKYHAWSGGSIGPAHTLAQSAFFRSSNVSKKVAGLFYAGATVQPGVGVPMCLISAENVLDRLF